MSTTTIIRISVDAGFTYTKVAMHHDGVLHTKCFNTNAIEDSNRADAGKEFWVDSKRYLVNYPTLEGATNKTAKDDNRYYVATMYAIYQMLNIVKPSDKDSILIKLAINMPVIEFKNKDTKQKRIEMYSTTKKDCIVLSQNGKMHHIEVDTKVYFEGYGAYKELEKHIGKGATISVVDLGSKNTTVVTFDGDGNIISNSSSSFPIGCNNLIFNLREPLELILGTVPTDDNIKQMLKNEYDWSILEPGQVDKVVNKVKDITVSHLEKVKYDLSERNVSPITNKISFAGGGADLLKDHISDVFPRNKMISKQPIFHNAIAGLKLLGVKVDVN